MSDSLTMTAGDIAGTIDHAVLRPEMTDADLVEHCRLAREYHPATVCVRPHDVAAGKKLLAGSDVGVSVVIGFPHGSNTTETKVYEAHRAMDDGAIELDMVIPIGKLRSGDWGYVERDVGAVVEAARAGDVLVKVIFENHYLTDEEVVRACKLCEALKADYVKTSTGFAGSGATLERVRLMRQSCGPAVGVKAAGGIRTLDQALEMLAAGASRLGCSSTKEIVEEARARRL